VIAVAVNYAVGAVTTGDIFGTGFTTMDLTNPTLDQNSDGQVDDVAKGQSPFPRGVVAILAFFGILVVVKFLVEKFD
jgi:hypothetical protein